MVNLTGLLAVILVFVGVSILLSVPTVLEWIVRLRFSRRFERLVQQGHIMPIFSRNPTKERNTSRPRRVTMQSLKEVWIGGQAPLNEDKGEWKVREFINEPLLLLFQYAFVSSSDCVPPQPVAAALISREDEQPAPVREAILTNRAQKKEAKRFLKTFRYKQIDVMNANTTAAAKGPAIAAPPTVFIVGPQTAAKLQFTTLILMPSESKLPPSLQHPQSTEAEAEAGPSTSEKRVGRWSMNATTPTVVPSPLPLGTRALAGVVAARKNDYPMGNDIPLANTLGRQTLSALEIGVAEQNLDQASDILKLAEKDNNDARASVGSFEGDGDFNDMFRALAAAHGPPMSRYAMYGRQGMRPTYMNPLIGGRTRVY